jgi:hypothetical protein
VKISDAKRELKVRHGLSQQEVMSNLTYLIDRDWVKTVEIQKTVRVKGEIRNPDASYADLDPARLTGRTSIEGLA